MDKKSKLLKWMEEGTDLSGEQVPGQFLVEILGQDRVLIENHRGVREYGEDRMGVKSGYGSVTVCGKGLELCRMSREQLIIRGRIDSVILHRGHC